VGELEADLSGFFPDRWRIANTIHQGETVTVEHPGEPRYVALQLRASQGDRIEVTATATNGGPVAFLVDPTSAVANGRLASSRQNESGPSTTISAIAPRGGVLYLAIRERNLQPTTFEVRVAGGEALRPLDKFEALFVKNWVPRPTDPGVVWNAPAAAYEGLAAASAYRRALEGAAFEPALRERFLAHMRLCADWLVDNSPSWKGVGWGILNAWDAFQDGTTNPADTVYAFQTGISVWALAEIAEILGDNRYRDMAKKAMDHYRLTAYLTPTTGLPTDCAECGYFLYSDAPGDRRRGTKNTNIEVALGGIALDYYFPDTANREASIAAATYHAIEIGVAKNYNYLSIWDPGYSPAGGRWDSHNASEAFWFLRAAQLAGRSDWVGYAIEQYQAYAPHAGTGFKNFMSCHFVDLLPEADATCTGWHEAGGAGTPVNGLRVLGLVMRY
jgi:hypothetical protein